MKIRFLLILFLIVASHAGFSQVVYSSTTEFGNRFNAGLGRAGTPKIVFDDISIPNSQVAVGDSIIITKVKVGVRRAPGAPAVDVKIYYTPYDDTSTDLSTYIKIPPVLLGTVSLPANPSNLVTTVVSVGDFVSNLFTLKTDTSAVFPGYRTFFIGTSLSSSNELNGLRFTTGPKVNSNHVWIYDADTTVSRYEGHFDYADASFYVQVFGHPASSTLPITLSSFKGEQKNGVNVLTWTTQTELNNKGFELQRSADGINFGTIEFVDTKATNGNSTSNLAYGCSDRNSFAGNNYYRLRQVDNDGRSSLSKVVLLRNDLAAALQFVNIYPNPAKSILHVAIASVAATKINVMISDFSGRILIKSSEKLVKGSNNFSFNVSALSSGSYIIKAVTENNNAAQVEKFVKQ